MEDIFLLPKAKAPVIFKVKTASALEFHILFFAFCLIRPDPDVQRYFRFLYKISIRHSLPDSCVTFSSHCHLSFSSYYNRKELFQFTESFR